jgi:hypothetical protein
VWISVGVVSGDVAKLIVNAKREGGLMLTRAEEQSDESLKRDSLLAPTILNLLMNHDGFRIGSS